MVREIGYHVGGTYTASSSPCGLRVVSGGADKKVSVWDFETGRQTHDLLGMTDWVTCAVFSFDGKRVAARDLNGVVCVWDLATCEELWRYEFGSMEGRILKFTKDSQRLYSHAERTNTIVWDAATGEIVQNAPRYFGSYKVVWAPDRSAWMKRFSQSRLGFLYLTVGKDIVLKGHARDRSLRDAAFSPDSKLVATASEDKTARIWDVQTGKQMYCLEGHTGKVTGVDFSPCGRFVVTSSEDRTVRTWDLF